MIRRAILVLTLSLTVSVSAPAQLSKDSRFQILHSVIAEQGAVRIAMPFGADGVELSDTGEIDQKKLADEMRKNGKSLDPGKIVSVTSIEFGDRTIEIELDGGGKNKKNGILSRISIGMSGKSDGTGGRDTSLDRTDTSKAKGSKIVLKFAKKVPADLTPAQLKQLLDPLMDFTKHDTLTTGIDTVPPQWKAAVLAKKAEIGMDRGIVIEAMGRPNQKIRETKDEIEQETWIYYGRGYRSTFVVFESNLVVSVKEF